MMNRAEIKKRLLNMPGGWEKAAITLLLEQLESTEGGHAIVLKEMRAKAKSLLERSRRAREVLILCAETFRQYEQNHRVKASLEKAAVNAERALLCEAMIKEIEL